MVRRVQFLCWGAGLVALPLILSGRASEPAPEKQPGTRLRRPLALLLADDDRKLLVANRDSGTVAVVDTQRLRVVSETRVGGRLSDLAASRDRELVLATDEEGGVLVALAYREGSLRELRRVKVGPTPVSVQVSDDLGVATVACLWPRRLLILDLASAAKPDEQKEAAPAVLDLPFAPRRQLLLPGGTKLVVADAFGDQLAVVDLRRKALESVRGLAEVHNIRGLALDRGRKNLLVTHQMLFSRGRPTPDDIRSGHLIDNRVLKLPVAKILEPSTGLRESGRPITLGDVERGAGDPAEAVENDEGQLLVTLAGTNELAVGWPEKATWTRLAVGQRPTALAVDAARRRAFVANTFADSVSVVDLQALKVVGDVRLGEPKELRPEERGEVLFHDARLSRDAWFSCHSCHTDGHTSGRLNDNLSDGSLGTPKRVLSLLGVKDTGPWAWNGKMADLPTQVRHSVKSTMQGRAPTDDEVRDLVAYLKTLPPPPSLTEARGTDAEAVKRGRKVFEEQKCAKCHEPPSYTSAGTYDVGLRDEAGETHFNPPSLRGVSQGGPYFHDGRAATLEEVFTRHRHRLADPLSDDELRDLLHFLRSL
jgi:cytochrome c peroxidase